jgi:hypothetical protein
MANRTAHSAAKVTHHDMSQGWHPGTISLTVFRRFPLVSAAGKRSPKVSAGCLLDKVA